MDLNRICLRCMDGEIGANNLCSRCGRQALTTQESTFALPLQSILHGRYLIGGILGQGGYGITYAAYDLTENRRVVIKELFPKDFVQRKPGTMQITVRKEQEFFIKTRQRFIEEAQMIFAFRNTPEIVDVYHVFLDNNTGYYAMEFLTGQTLENRRQSNGGRLTWDQLSPVMRDVFKALRVVHDFGSIHRDISPDNIYLSASGRAKLIDFGAARRYKTGQNMTTILKKGFAPWEQYRSNGKFGPWTDVYALSATIYFCLSGHLPPEAPDRAQYGVPLPPLSGYGVALPPGVETAITQGLSVRVEDRFQTVDSLAAALHMNTLPPVPPPPPSPPPVNANTNWQLRGIRGRYAGVRIPFRSNIIIGRDPDRCTLVYPTDTPGISRVHVTLLYGRGPSFPGIRCESASQVIYINGTMFSGQGRLGVLQNGDRISIGDNQIFIIERVNS